MARTTRCPVCRGPVERTTETFPFCTRRCRSVDLGGWLGETYRVPDAPPPELEEAVLKQLLEEAGDDEWPNA